MSETEEIISISEEETLALGESIGRSLKGGELICLIGPLGSGKSVLARGIAKGLGIDGPVRSPSFNLMREYKGKLILRHWDLYRLESSFNELGILESLDDDAVTLVEWAERWDTLKNYAAMEIHMDYCGSETERSIIIITNIE